MTPPLTLQPAPAYTLLRHLGLITAAAAILLSSLLLPWPAWLPGSWVLPLVAILGAAATLVWTELERRATRYILTGESLTWQCGVLTRLRVDIPLDRIQNLVLVRSVAERLAGLGSIGIATAGTGGYEAVWSMLHRPEEVLGAIRRASDARRAAGADSGNDLAVSPRSTSTVGRIPVIGLAGGIGSGKSRIAALLGELGCLVIDSDQRARAALDRPEVRDQLVQWWGATILGPDGRINRAGVAEIVFARPDERARLEGLVHPIVRQDRAAMIAEAVASGRPVRSIVIDAPLLFEAGLDAECDAVIFVDAPRPQRLERVRKSRNWSEDELDRRESAQWSLDRKKSAATHIVNNQDGADPKAELQRILNELARELPGV